MLARVRHAVHMADSLQLGNTAVTEELLHAAEHFREANREFLRVLEHLRPATAAGHAARAQLQQQLTNLDCGNELLRSMLEPGSAQQSEIHTQTPRDQVQ